MYYVNDYNSPLGKILLSCDDEGLSGLWFYGGRDFANGLNDERKYTEHHILDEAKRWLDVYFSGKCPDFTPPIHVSGTEFQRKVWDIPVNNGGVPPFLRTFSSVFYCYTKA